MRIPTPEVLESSGYWHVGGHDVRHSITASLSHLSPKSFRNPKIVRSAVLVAVLLFLTDILYIYRDRLRSVYGSEGQSLDAVDREILEEAIPPIPTSDILTITNNAEALDAISNNVEWSRFAYIQYVTNTQYLCNSLMLFARLNHFGCRASRMMMHPEGWSPNSDPEAHITDETRLLRLARDTYNVSLQPIHVQSKTGTADREYPQTRTPQTEPRTD